MNRRKDQNYKNNFFAELGVLSLTLAVIGVSTTILFSGRLYSDLLLELAKYSCLASFTALISFTGHVYLRTARSNYSIKDKGYSLLLFTDRLLSTTGVASILVALFLISILVGAAR